MKVGFVTTLDTNIGDDLIRRGIVNILEGMPQAQGSTYACLNKHRPLEVYRFLHAEALLDAMPKRRDRMRRAIERRIPTFWPTMFDDAELIVQCGAPIFWPDCWRAEWAPTLWYRVLPRRKQEVPVLNLAGGSCYPWSTRDAVSLAPRDRDYIRQMTSASTLTVVRDRLAQKICKGLGTPSFQLPCSAFLAAANEPRERTERSQILINYMPGGGHYSWNQDIDAPEWENTVRTLAARLSKLGSVAFLAHDQSELDVAARLFPEYPRLMPKSADEYFAVCSNARIGLFNRLHAAVALAGMGIPSIAVGTDTRMLMVEALDLPVAFVKDASVEFLEVRLHDLWGRHREHEERLLSLVPETMVRYRELIRDVL